MGLKSLGENTASEFFDTLIYFTAFEETQKILDNLTKDIPEGPIREAIENSLNVLAFGLVFELIRMEEAFVQRIFNIAYGLVVALIGFGAKLKRAIFRGKGIKAFLRGVIGSISDKSDLLAQLVVMQAGNQVQARQSVYNSSGHQGLFGTYIETKKYLIDKEQHHLNVANDMTKRYLETLLFKLFTANFTENDKRILEKILGKPTIDIQDINKISEFIFVRDSEGHIVGLSKAFLELVNGLGYLHNK